MRDRRTRWQLVLKKGSSSFVMRSSFVGGRRRRLRGEDGGVEFLIVL